ncbi:PEPxxWA-CTERM sorting domain-containing protein [Glacieibacterium frigidum]|uniref:PEP-CTERM sorting domain-containing protein n=1 Tax=Glacieibacterium frigidum TaxID=2593303 RepID=A0A552UFI9_9SPHN|nr:PEPxxWA-CTERM sorting domain-containing protein [Glacieibacterium frigidum]TRW16949.1 PEP-CTERM sorting domain-containing protein [Glacieibacterium frigidum]
MRIWNVAAIVVGLAATPALAEVQTVNLNVSFADTPFTYDFGGGNTITFTALSDFFNPAGVSTGGSTQIASLGAPFFNPPRPTSYFLDRGGSIGPDTLAQFIGYTTPAAVPFSISRGLVGLRFDLGQGFQYGYADVAGNTLFGVRFDTTPGVGVALAPVPEPGTWALMIGGFAAVGVMERRRRRVVAY